MAEEHRTEPATPRKRRRVRERGQVARSVEIVSAVSLFLVFATLYLTSGFMDAEYRRFVEHLLGSAGEIELTVATVPAIAQMTLTVVLIVLAPVLLVAFAGGLLASVAQVGFVFSADPVSPKLDRINPVSGFKRLFSFRAVFDTFKNFLKIILVGAIALSVLRQEAPGLLLLTDLSPSASFLYVLRIALRIGLLCSAVLMILAVLDYAYQRFEFEKQIRMTRQEVKDELKEQEGDPLVRRRLREFARAIALRRMIHRVKEADVVVTNPTEYAVALLYEPEFEAPRVIAKGKGYMAERIKREALRWEVPLYEDRLLAQALYRVGIDELIPPKLFQAVAQVLAFLSRVDERMRRKLSSLRV